MNIKGRLDRAEERAGIGAKAGDFDLTVLSDADLLKGERLLSKADRTDGEDAEVERIFALCRRHE